MNMKKKELENNCHKKEEKERNWMRRALIYGDAYAIWPRIYEFFFAERNEKKRKADLEKAGEMLKNNPDSPE